MNMGSRLPDNEATLQNMLQHEPEDERNAIGFSLLKKLFADALHPSMADILWIGVVGSPVAEYWEWDGTIDQARMSAAAVPAPATMVMALLGAGFAGLFGLKSRKQ